MEIEGITIMSAEEARKAIEKAEAARTEEELLQKIEYVERCRTEAIERIPGTLNAINELIENSVKARVHYLAINLQEFASENINKVPYTDFIYAEDLYREIFTKKLGYYFKIVWYSDKWAEKTGRMGYIIIGWKGSC